ncbi:hypothetical protein GJ698_11040 [Pseudoduganella sp. FT26W]|uniref:Uncharacterized protein n=1 Tax=Duganella aquatilis TaxID=2666082 RepID=A0A844D0Y9_9BURK|nr:hypothetical protein [Duganella aquatilis]MRW84621.1 hypothetical protein [Duganella aquatilis]
MSKNALLFCMCVVVTALCSAAPTASDRIRFDGIGDIKIGQTFDEVSKLWPSEIKPIPPGLKASPDCYHVSPTNHPGVTLMFRHDHLVRIDLTKKTGQTKSGVRIGDDFAVLKRHYQDAVFTNQNSSVEDRQVTISSPDKKYAFRFYFEHSKIASISSGQVDAVALDEGCY